MMHNVNISSHAELCEYLDHGGFAKFLFFWGHQPAQAGFTTKTCFSQWFESAFEVNGIRYPTAEHYMMAEKARLFADHEALQRILTAPNPGAAKALGREIRHFDEKVWVKHRFAIVVAANIAKFSQHPALGEFLINTGNRVLVEASPVDRIWGNGLAADHPAAENPHEWQGLNLLGFALMQVREQLTI
ncbi:NADAR family protein [Thiothrix fructosivorans]|nr:NADAR family protein [Thiothrix fructosivorans]